MVHLFVHVFTGALVAHLLPKPTNSFLPPNKLDYRCSRPRHESSSSSFQYNEPYMYSNTDDTDDEASYYVDLWQQQQQQQKQQQQFLDPTEYEQQQQQQQEERDWQYQQQHHYEQQYQYEQNPDAEEQSLLITTNMSDELRRVISNSPDFSAGIDYLSLARQRAMERRESINSLSSDEDWVELAKAKASTSTSLSEDDGWESSLNDTGGTSDSAALGLGGMVVKLEAGERDGIMVTESGLIVDIGMEDNDENGPQLIW